MSESATVVSHFKKSTDLVRATYDAVLAAARSIGAIREDAKKTSIHLVRSSAFAGVATRRESLILTLKAAWKTRSDKKIVDEAPATVTALLEFVRTGNSARIPKRITLPVPRFALPDFPPVKKSQRITETVLVPFGSTG